jgi:hypothetical protein
MELALQPVPEIDFVLQMFTVGGVGGLVIAYRAWRRGFQIGSWVITARWSIVGLVAGILIALWKGLT